jgi:DNA topoisomerase-1
MVSSSEDEFEDVPLSKLSANRTKAKATRSKGNGAARPDYVESKDDDDSDFAPQSKSKKSAVKKNGKSSNKRKTKKDDDDFRKKKKVKNGTNGTKAKLKVKKENSNVPKAPAPKKLKKLDKADRIAHAMQSFLWWDAPSPPDGCQWSTMEHAGVSFTEPYEPHGVKMKYDGEEINLSPVEEEA